MKAFREKMKQDPEKYQKYLCKNKEKCRTYRANMTVKKKAQETEKGKELVRKSRQRKKMLKQAEPPRVLMWTVSGPTQEAERAEWQEEKNGQAVNMHWKTRQAKNERQRLLYCQRQEAKRVTSSEAVQCYAPASQEEDPHAPKDEEHTPVASLQLQVETSQVWKFIKSLKRKEKEKKLNASSETRLKHTQKRLKTMLVFQIFRVNTCFKNRQIIYNASR